MPLHRQQTRNGTPAYISGRAGNDFDATLAWSEAAATTLVDSCDGLLSVQHVGNRRSLQVLSSFTFLRRHLCGASVQTVEQGLGGASSAKAADMVGLSDRMQGWNSTAFGGVIQGFKSPELVQLIHTSHSASVSDACPRRLLLAQDWQQTILSTQGSTLQTSLRPFSPTILRHTGSVLLC